MKLSEIQQKLKVPKSHRNEFAKYDYRNAEDILEAVKPLLGTSLLLLSDEIVQIGDRFYVKATATFVDHEPAASDIGKLTTVVTAYAREPLEKKGSDASQITGAASSYARKYALNGLFLIDDTKDADSEDNSAKTTETPKTLPEAKTASWRRANPPVYKSPGIKEQEAKKRIADLIIKLTDEEAPSDKAEAAKWYGDKVFEFTGESLSLATLEDLERIGDTLGNMYDNQK